MSNAALKHPSSYRDPSGFIFERDGIIYRQVNTSFAADFDHFINSGCYDHLVKKGLLIPHEIVPGNFFSDDKWHTTLRPERIHFISYPYEWSFDMLKDAALLTLQLAKETLTFGIVLKDATPYNIQWHEGRLLFIDTLSFERYNEASPWIAYRQFCESFLGPLLIMHHKKIPLQQLSLAYPDGIPLRIVKSMLPSKSRFSLYTYLHIFLHAKISTAPARSDEKAPAFSKQKLVNLLSSLESLIRTLSLPSEDSVWSGYYEEAAQRKDYLDQKKKIITHWIEQFGAVHTCADLGANEGAFSKLAAIRQLKTIAADFDPWCINRLYQEIKRTGEKNIQPLVLDLANPSPAIGVNNEERTSFITRLDADLVMALALIHHLAIGKNITFDLIAGFFNRAGKNLIIEFIPKEDEKIQLMLKGKKDIYTDYTESNFEAQFKLFFLIEQKEKIGNSNRVLYFMKRRELSS